MSYSITTYDAFGKILSTMKLYEGADFDFYAQGSNYINGYYLASEYFIDNGIAVKFPEKPENTIWDWDTKQWVLSADIASSKVISQRDKLLYESDWTQIPNNPLTPEKQEEWAVYRQQLRDITIQPGYPFNVVWPTKPE